MRPLFLFLPVAMLISLPHVGCIGVTTGPSIAGCDMATSTSLSSTDEQTRTEELKASLEVLYELEGAWEVELSCGDETSEIEILIDGANEQSVFLLNEPSDLGDGQEYVCEAIAESRASMTINSVSGASNESFGAHFLLFGSTKVEPVTGGGSNASITVTLAIDRDLAVNGYASEFVSENSQKRCQLLNWRKANTE